MTFDDFNNMPLAEVAAMTEPASSPLIARILLDAGALGIRDVAGGEEAYHYSSGNFGPGYVLVKGVVGRQKHFKFLVRQLALRLSSCRSFDFIAGLVTGGVPPSLLLRDYLQELQGREIPWVYIRNTRKEGGTREHVTGITDLMTGGVNPEIPEGSTALVVEELTNYANSLTNGAGALRNSGYRCDQGASILDYAHAESEATLQSAALILESLVTLEEVLREAEAGKLFSDKLIEDYRWFRRNPGEWMAHYGYVRKEHAR